MILVSEVFFTIQGEATFAGTPSMFIRLMGCPVGCKFCDTKYTWNALPRNKVEFSEVVGKTQPSPKYAQCTVDDLKAIWATSPTPHVVVTGGEPFLQADACADIAEAFRVAGVTVQFETSGTIAMPEWIGPAPWITCSPKIGKPGGYGVIPQVVRCASEIKLPVEFQQDYLELQEYLKCHNIVVHPRTIWLQPISQGAVATQLCINYCMQAGHRLSVQTHKYINLP